MSNSVDNEKYISIEYNTWINKYKPLEERYEELRKKLEKEREDKTIRLNVSSSRYGDMRNCIGSLDLSVAMPNQLRINFPDLKDFIEKHLSGSRNSYTNLLTSEQACTLAKNIEGQQNKLTEDRMAFYKNVAGIPRIIKWLFKIKSI